MLNISRGTDGPYKCMYVFSDIITEAWLVTNSHMSIEYDDMDTSVLSEKDDNGSHGFISCPAAIL